MWFGLIIFPDIFPRAGLGRMRCAKIQLAQIGCGCKMRKPEFDFEMVLKRAGTA
jgi:hypothetical protein